MNATTLEDRMRAFIATLESTEQKEEFLSIARDIATFTKGE